MRKIRKILLVDDDEITCFVNNMVLEDMEVADQIVAVHNGRQALQYIKGKHIGDGNCQTHKDLIFLDLNMPVMGGFDFLDALQKSGHEYQNVLKVVILTSSNHEIDAKEAVQYNDLVHSYLVKPLEKEKITDVIESIVEPVESKNI